MRLIKQRPCPRVSDKNSVEQRIGSLRYPQFCSLSAVLDIDPALHINVQYSSCNFSTRRHSGCEHVRQQFAVEAKVECALGNPCQCRITRSVEMQKTKTRLIGIRSLRLHPLWLCGLHSVRYVCPLLCITGTAFVAVDTVHYCRCKVDMQRHKLHAQRRQRSVTILLYQMSGTSNFKTAAYLCMSPYGTG